LPQINADVKKQSGRNRGRETESLSTDFTDYTDFSQRVKEKIEIQFLVCCLWTIDHGLFSLQLAASMGILLNIACHTEVVCNKLLYIRSNK
jgi:hypothetical protein